MQVIGEEHAKVGDIYLSQVSIRAYGLACGFENSGCHPIVRNPSKEMRGNTKVQQKGVQKEIPSQKLQKCDKNLTRRTYLHELLYRPQLNYTKHLTGRFRQQANAAAGGAGGVLA